MSTFHHQTGDNIRALRDWHHKTHTHALRWESCPWSPCDQLEPDFREAWSK